MNNCQFFARVTVEICRIFHIKERNVACLSRKRETSMNAGREKMRRNAARKLQV